MGVLGKESLLVRVVTVSLIQKVAFEQRRLGGEELSHSIIWRERIPDRRHSECKLLVILFHHLKVGKRLE